MGALLQLECFDRVGVLPREPIHTADDVRAAFDEGIRIGRAETRRQQADDLTAALAQLADQLATARSAALAEGAQRAQSLRPLIVALLDGVLPALARARLEAALLAALLRLAEQVSPLRLGLSCGPDLAAFVSACAERAGLTDLTLDPNGPEGTVTAELLGGVMVWDEQAVADQLRAIVLETLEEH